MAFLTCQSWLDDMQHPKKTVKHCLSSEDGENSWANASAELNARSLGSFATNNIAEQAFGEMTHMHEKFNMILGGNAADVSQARTGGDWDREVCGCESDGAFHQLNIQMQESLMATGI